MSFFGIALHVIVVGAVAASARDSIEGECSTAELSAQVAGGALVQKLIREATAQAVSSNEDAEVPLGVSYLASDSSLLSTRVSLRKHKSAVAPDTPCENWCESDYNEGKNEGRHCSPGDMANLCGGCSFCGGVPSPAPSPPPTPPAQGVPCQSWCEADYNGGNNAGRHCGSGDMAQLCGSCSFCSGAPSPSPSPVTSDCARRLNNYDRRNAACLVKNNTKAMLVYVPYGSPGWDLPGGTRHSGDYACEVAERETCEESSYKVRALYQLSYNVFMCEIVQVGFCTKPVDEGFLEKRWVTRAEVGTVNYRPNTWGDKQGLLYANL